MQVAGEAQQHPRLGLSAGASLSLLLIWKREELIKGKVGE